MGLERSGSFTLVFPLVAAARGPILTAVIATLLVSGCGLPFGGESNLDTSAGSAAVTELIQSVLATNDAGADVALETCPYDTDGSLLAAAVSDVTSNDVDRSLGEGSIPTSSVNAIDGGFVICLRFDPDSDSAIGLDVSNAPDDFEAYLQDYLDPFDDFVGGSSDDITVERSSTDHRGGTLHQICVEYADTPEANLCEVNWVNDDLLVALYVVGVDAPDVDPSALEQGLTTVLPDVTSNLEGVADLAVGS